MTLSAAVPVEKKKAEKKTDTTSKIQDSKKRIRKDTTTAKEKNSKKAKVMNQVAEDF